MENNSDYERHADSDEDGNKRKKRVGTSNNAIARLEKGADVEVRMREERDECLYFTEKFRMAASVAGSCVAVSGADKVNEWRHYLSSRF